MLRLATPSFALYKPPLNLVLGVVINRCAIILKYRKPAVAWINDADPHIDKPNIEMDSVNEDRTVYLVHDEVGDSPSNIRQWIELNFAVLFENELEGWYTDPSLWPNNRGISTFDEWFDVEYHTVLVDTLEGPIMDDELEF